MLEFWLSKLREYLTADAAGTEIFLGKDSPETLSARLAKSKLADPALRRKLWEGGKAAIQASDDPMIHFVLATDAASRAVRKDYETPRQRADRPRGAETSPRPASRSMAPIPIPTRPSRSGCPMERSAAGLTMALRWAPSPASAACGSAPPASSPTTWRRVGRQAQGKRRSATRFSTSPATMTLSAAIPARR